MHKKKQFYINHTSHLKTICLCNNLPTRIREIQISLKKSLCNCQVPQRISKAESEGIQIFCKLTSRHLPKQFSCLLYSTKNSSCNWVLKPRLHIYIFLFVCLFLFFCLMEFICSSIFSNQNEEVCTWSIYAVVWLSLHI